MMEPEDLPELEGELDKRAMGMYPKYDVIKRADGTLVTEPVFVMKPDTDVHARAALRGYAEDVIADGYEKLGQDILAWIASIEARDIAHLPKLTADELHTKIMEDITSNSPGLKNMPHNHAQYVPGCVRCDLARQELGVLGKNTWERLDADERN